MRSLLASAAVVVSTTTIWSVSACRQPEQPPLVPPAPTNPNVADKVAFQPADVIDASIVTEGGAIDATGFEIEAAPASVTHR
jgi:hypothetical protein